MFPCDEVLFLSGVGFWLSWGRTLIYSLLLMLLLPIPAVLMYLSSVWLKGQWGTMLWYFLLCRKWFGHTYTHTPSPSDSMPISTITNCGLEFPGLYHRFLLASHSMYSVCRSQSQTPSPCCCGLGSNGTHPVFQGWESVSVPCTCSFVSSLLVPLRSGIIRCLSFPVHLHLGW